MMSGFGHRAGWSLGPTRFKAIKARPKALLLVDSSGIATSHWVSSDLSQMVYHLGSQTPVPVPTKVVQYMCYESAYHVPTLRPQDSHATFVLRCHVL